MESCFGLKGYSEQPRSVHHVTDARGSRVHVTLAIHVTLGGFTAHNIKSDACVYLFKPFVAYLSSQHLQGEADLIRQGRVPVLLCGGVVLYLT
jgi:hypothetical protein